jgi:putative Holliday junction resolvase
MARILAVDPGEVRIGLAISDPTGMLARPYKVLKHKSRRVDAIQISQEASQQAAALILVGLPLNQDGQVGPQARKSLRLVDAIKEETDIAVETWDESGTTKRALASHEEDELLDARAAAYMLQDYLDAQ